jgi:hypothetical protein
MCFSATASFTASFSLSVLGIATLTQTTSKNQLLLAAFPLFFASQQLLEGIVWLTLNKPLTPLHFMATYGFLGFATAIWLIFCPFSVYLLEAHPIRKKLILGITVIGTILGTYLFSYVVIQGIIPINYSGHLLYDLNFIPFYNICKYLYLLVVSVPFLISSQRLLVLFGVLAMVSFLVADQFYQVTFVSVWCFFAAILSSGLFLIFWYGKMELSKLNGVES